MRVHDEGEWQLQRAAFAVDPAPQADKMLRFVETWAGAAEDFLARRTGEAPIVALRNTLRDTEERTEHLTIGFVGQALLLLCTYWAPIEDRDVFFDSMTTIEQNLFVDAKVLWEMSQAIQAMPDE